MTQITLKHTTLIALLGILLVSFFVNFVKNFDLSDDNLYLYQSISTVVLDDNESAKRQNYILDESLKLETIESKEFSDRWRMRAEYAGNYVASIYLYSLGSKVSKFLNNESEFNANFVSKMLMSFVFPFLLLGVILIVFFKRMDDALLTLSVTLTVVVLYFTNEYFPRGGQNFFDYGIVNFIKFVISPGYGLTPLGFTPRSHMMLLAIPIFALWLRGSLFPAYLGVFFLLYVHNSMAFILVPFLFMTDVLFRFQKIRKLHVLLLLSALCLTYLSRESFFIVEDRDILRLSAFLILPFSFYFRIKYRSVDSDSGFGSNSALRLCLSIILLWLLVFLGFFFFSFFLPETTFPVWYIFPGRSLAVLRPLIIFGIIYHLIRVFYTQEVLWERTFKASIISLLLVLTSSYQQVGGKVDSFTDAMVTEFNVLNITADTSLLYKKDNEAYFYFQLIRDHELRLSQGD